MHIFSMHFKSSTDAILIPLNSSLIHFRCILSMQSLHLNFHHARQIPVPCISVLFHAAHQISSSMHFSALPCSTSKFQFHAFQCKSFMHLKFQFHAFQCICSMQHIKHHFRAACKFYAFLVKHHLISALRWWGWFAGTCIQFMQVPCRFHAVHKFNSRSFACLSGAISWNTKHAIMQGWAVVQFDGTSNVYMHIQTQLCVRAAVQQVQNCTHTIHVAVKWKHTLSLMTWCT